MLRQSGRQKSTGDSAGVLRIHLLGPPKVEGADRALALPRRQVRALLFRLAARCQPVPRDELCYLFWADKPDTTARRNLRGLLTHLRSALPAPALLITSQDVVGLDPDSVWSDTVLFERLCTSPKLSTQVEALEQAVELYHGSFLAGFSLPACPEYEIWATTERRTWEGLYLEALASLVEERTAQGEYAAAIAYAGRYLATDALAEDIHRRLIELYAASGDRSAALRQFEECLTVLERELGVDPLPETQAAYRAALDGFPLPGTAPAAEPAWMTLPGLNVPLIGRDGAMDQLNEAFARARAGHAAVVLISGEAGIGKSRLMQEFATRMQERALVLAGCGHADAQETPYQPVIETLRTAMGIQPLCLNVQPVWLAEAARLMPELRDLVPSLPLPLPAEPEHARAKLFEALCQLTLALATGASPLLLCLDDLHWFDRATLDWLGHLGRKLRNNRLLVVGTFRSAEASAVAGLRRGLTRQGILTELKLKQLDQAAVLQMLRCIGDPVLNGKALARRLHRVTGGNPFFLLETLRALLESDLERQDMEGLDLPLPESIRAAVDARVERLSARARQILEVGAVLGRTFTFDLVRRTAGRRELEAVGGLDELVARQLLMEREGQYWFHHEIIGDVVYHGLSRHRRWLLHRRAGETLEQLQSRDAAALARHFELGGDPERAARYALQAGQAAKAIYGHVEAGVHSSRALALLEQQVADLRDPEAIAANRRLRIQALYERGWALRLLGDMKAYAQDLVEVTRLAELLGDQCTLAHLRWREAFAHRWFCRYAEAREASTQGLRLSHAVGDCALVAQCWDEGLRANCSAGHCLFEALCWREFGLAAREMGDLEQARSALKQALERFAGLDEATYEIHTLGNLSTLSCYMGDHEKAMELAQQALVRCENAGLPLHRRIPLGDMGAAAAVMGSADLARDCLMDSLSIARQVADRTQQIFCLGHLGWLHVQLRQSAAALERLQAGLTLAEKIGSCAEQSWLLSGLAEAHRLAGECERAQVHAVRALELAQATGRPHDEGLACQVLDRLEGG